MSDNTEVITMAAEYGVTITEQEASRVLWEFTLFPLADKDFIEKQLRHRFERMAAGETLDDFAAEEDRIWDEAQGEPDA